MPQETSNRSGVALDVHLVGADDYQTMVFRNTAVSCGITSVALYPGAKAAISGMFHGGMPDMLFVWFSNRASDSLQLCRLVRSRDAFPRPFLPIAAIIEKATVSAVTSVRDVGVDGFLACPFSAKSLSERVHAIRDNRRGFMSVPDYFGPDRRCGAMAKWLGADRRSAPSTLIDPVTEQLYTG